ncbi:hypothetical protein PTKIN_Ptkin16aG0529500 [Pterospermum kingtungense]
MNCTKLKQIPLYLPLLDMDKGKQCLPHLKEIFMEPKELWESVEWDHPHAKNALLPFLKLWDDLWDESILFDEVCLKA